MRYKLITLALAFALIALSLFAVRGGPLDSVAILRAEQPQPCVDAKKEGEDMPLGARRGSLVLPDPGRAALEQMDGQWALPRKHVLKSADETVNNSTTIQDDDELLFFVNGGETWRFEGSLFIQGTALGTTDFKIQIDGPSGAAGRVGLSLGATSIDSRDIAIGGITTMFVAAGETHGWLHFSGVIRNGATPGNLKVRWAQNTADASDTIVKQDSYLVAHQLS